MTVDIFKTLCVGVRFKRPASEPLNAKAVVTKKTETRKQDDVGQDKLPDELDFFAKGKSPETSKDTTSVSVVTESTTTFKIPKKPIFNTDPEMHVFRKKKGIKASGAAVPHPVKKFADLCRPEYAVEVTTVQKVLDAGLSRMTPIQQQGIPALLTGRDAFIIAPTGSGKTLVYVISLLTSIRQLMRSSEESKGVLAVVLAPTKELAMQIKSEFDRFTGDRKTSKCKETLINCVLLNKTVHRSWKGQTPKVFPKIVVATSKRLVMAIEEKVLDLTTTRHIVLDEGDRLLEGGLMEQLDDILAAATTTASEEDDQNNNKSNNDKQLPRQLQKVLLSATMPTGIEDLAKSFMSSDPIKIVIGKANAATRNIEQKLLYVGQEEGKLMAIRQMLTEGIQPPVIIFLETIEKATRLFHELVAHGINVDIIHGDRSPAEREAIVGQFRAGRVWFLITTELFARGLDFPEVTNVINYDFPASTASYIHRIGRTGRAGRKGKAITFFTNEDVGSLRIAANVMRQSGCDVPDWMLQIKRTNRKAPIKKAKVAQ